jgi:hypothetical protein
MKFTLAVIVAAAASMADGFAPIVAPKTNGIARSMATETSTKPYTFTKSEEIFAEAQTVSTILVMLSRFFFVCCGHIVSDLF